jgi:hypothetical protein
METEEGDGLDNQRQIGMWSPEIEMPKSPIIDVDKNGHF